MKNTACCLVILMLLALVTPGLAHPVPDVPVRAEFAQDGAWTLQVEVDPRCFEPDPNIALSVTNADLALFTPERKAQLQAAARDYMKRVVEIVLDPAVPVNPEFVFEFTGQENVPLKMPEDIVVLTGTWRTKVPPGTTGYAIKALPAGTLSVLYHNTALGKKLDRFQILFPGESSFVLDLQTYTARTKAAPVITAPEEIADGYCLSCYLSPQGGYALPAVAAAVVIVLLVAWRRKQRRT